MKQLRPLHLLMRLIIEETGGETLEYALVVGLIIIGAIGAGLHLNIPGRIEISGNKNA